MLDEEFIGRPLDLLLGYEPGMTMPTIHGWRDKQWHPEDAVTGREGTPAEAVQQRTASEDAFVHWRAKHIMGGRWRKLNMRSARQIACDTRTLQARRIVRRAIETGKIDMSEIPEGSDTARAEDALTFLVSVVKNAAESTKDRIAASKGLLEFTRQKPAQRGVVAIKSALSFLDEIAGDDE